MALVNDTVFFPHTTANKHSFLSFFLQQATMDFTTASTNTAQVGVLLDDTSAVLLHQQDVGDAVCVLAINPYGETEMGSTLTGGPTKSETDSSIAGDTLAENTQQSDKISPFAQAAEVISNDSSAVVRGRRSWRETVGGGSICCSQCCSVLGFASLTSPETYRFLKHRLVVGNASNETTTTTCIDNDAIPLMQCACFVAHEMIRYAETKAVFTFVVERGDSFVAPTKPGHENRTRVLLLKLLSWDSYAASNTDEEDKNVTATKPVQFQKTAKIIYEESWLDDNSVNNSKATTGDDGNEDITQWVWGGADLCCLPGTSSGSLPSASANLAVGKEASKEQPPQTLSSVRLRLEEQEWDELRESLQVGSKYFSKEVIDETILTKLGRREMPPSTKSTLNHPSLIMPLGLSAIRIN